MKRSTPRAAALFLAATAFVACSAGSEPEEHVGNIRNAASVGGCACPSSGGCSALSYSDVPADGVFYITTFGGGSDTQPMSCGGTADGTWAYVADSARFGCKAKLLIEANGKSCVAEVRDCGPNRCVEQAACSCSCSGHFPIIDASPFISTHLMGTSSVGWSEKKSVKVTLLDPATPIGCPGGPVSIEAGNDAAPEVGAGGARGAGAGPSGGGAGLTGAGTGGNAGAPSGGSAGAAANPTASSDDAGSCACALGRRNLDGWVGLGVLVAAAALRSKRVLGSVRSKASRTRSDAARA